MNQKAARVAIALGVPALAASFGYLPFFLLKSDLPNPVASHFSASGVPDGSMSPNGFLGVTSAMFGVGALLCIAVAIYPRMLSGLVKVGLASMGGFLTAFASGLLLEVVLSQRGLASWTEASFSWPLTLLALVLGVGVAALAARLASVLPTLRPDLPQSAQPLMILSDSENAVWSGQLRSSLLTIVSLGWVVFAGFLALATSKWISMVAMLAVGVAMLALSSVRVSVDRSGLRVRYGMLPWPSTHIGVAEIETATVIDVRPKEWGGWGYRGSLKVMNQAAVVLRAGPGIRLDLRNGKAFVVTVDDPEVAVGLLNAQVQRESVSI